MIKTTKEQRMEIQSRCEKAGMKVNSSRISKEGLVRLFLFMHYDFGALSGQRANLVAVDPGTSPLLAYLYSTETGKEVYVGSVKI